MVANFCLMSQAYYPDYVIINCSGAAQQRPNLFPHNETTYWSPKGTELIEFSADKMKGVVNGISWDDK
jgi:hypothetical protein